MSITNELRKWVETLYIPCSGELTREAERIADRIDAEHERLMGEQYKSLTIDMKPMTDENMAESGWVRLPVDGDGKPIHVGDVIAHVPDGINKLAPETVTRIVLSKDEQRIVTEDCSYSVPKFLRHVEPTVADVLREFRDEVRRCCDTDDTIAEYADRIREAVEHE